MARQGIISWIGLLLAAVLFVAVNALFNVSAPELRLDVTEDGLYTLSEGTHEILAKIDEPVVLHYFFTEDLGRQVPVYASYGLRVRELLNEVAAASDGKVILREHDPAPFSTSEDLAVSFGIQGIPVDQSGALAYFGLAGTNSVDETERIPFFQPERERLLEYDLAQMIHALSDPDPTLVGIQGSLPVLGDMRAQMQGGVLVPWAIARRLRDNFDTLNLPETLDDLPASVDVMMLVHPRAMNERAVYAFEQFLFRGGRAILFLDPKAESDRSVGPDSVSSSTDGLQLLLQAWGIAVPKDQLVADRSMALRINAGTAARPVPADFLVWLGIAPEFMSQEDPVTSQLPALNLASAGFITQRKESPLKLEPLISSSRNSSPIGVDEVRGARPDVLGLLDRFAPDDQAYHLAARLTGVVATAFPEGPPAPSLGTSAAGSAADVPQLLQSDGPINVILVADADLLEDRFWLRSRQFFGREVEEEIAGNASFVINAIGNLAGSDALLRLRSRGVAQRPFEKVRELEQDAERRLQEKERDLQDKLKETQDKIAGLEGVRTIEDAVSGERKVEVSLTRKQRSEVEALRGQMLAIRQQLREVQHGLREDVDRLETWLQFTNIGLVPIAVSLVALIIGAVRLARRRRSYEDAREGAVI